MLTRINRDVLITDAKNVMSSYILDFDNNEKYTVYLGDSGYVVDSGDDMTHCFSYPRYKRTSSDADICLYKNEYASTNPTDPRYARILFAYSAAKQSDLSFCFFEYTTDDVDHLISVKVRQLRPKARLLTPDEFAISRYNVLYIISGRYNHCNKISDVLDYLVENRMYPFSSFLDTLCTGVKWLN